MTDKQLKFVIGVATLIGFYWFFTRSGIVFNATQPAVAEGKLGNPAVAGGLVFLFEIVASLGATMLIMSTKAYNWIANKITPLFESEEQGAEDFVASALNTKGLSPERREEIQTALILSAELKDWKSVIKASELLAGEKFFQRKKGTNVPETTDTE